MSLMPLTELSRDLLPIAGFQAHLRLGTGYGEDESQTQLLESFLRAAISAIEMRTEKILFNRAFYWRISQWKSATKHPFPIAPITNIDHLRILRVNSALEHIPLENVTLLKDMTRPVLQVKSGQLPILAMGDQAEIGFHAGLADEWSKLPGDLQQAVFLLAAHYYTYREERALGHGCMPFGVTSLIERYLPRRLGGFDWRARA